MNCNHINYQQTFGHTYYIYENLQKCEKQNNLWYTYCVPLYDNVLYLFDQVVRVQWYDIDYCEC